MGMVLINDVTKEDINAALIRLQKQGGVSQGGGTTTQQTIQNIQIQNSGSGSGSSSDVNAQLAELRNAIREQNIKIYNLEKRNSELEAIKDNLLDVQAYINSSAAGNITNITFNDATRQLSLATDVNTAMVSIPDGAYRYEERGPAFCLCKFKCKANKETRLSFCMGGIHELDPTQAESLRVMSYAEVNITTQQYLPSGTATWKSIVAINGFCTENSETPDTVKYNMGDIIIWAYSNAQNENVTYEIYYVVSNGSSSAYAHKSIPIWWKIMVNETEDFQLVDDWSGGYQESQGTGILWNSRYGFNESYSNFSTKIDTTKSYSHFQNLANIQGGGGGGSSLDLQGATYGTNTYTDNNPKIRFKNRDASQNISLTFTDYDAVQAPASLTLNGNQGGEYFIAPNIKTTGKYYGRVNLSSTAGNANGDIWIA